MNLNKHISLFLLFGFSVLLGHSMVPHHHHAEIVSGSIHKECPVEHSDHHNSDTEPLHCHAFNNVDFFKDSPASCQQQPKVLVTLTIPATRHSAEITLSNLSFRFIAFSLPVRSVSYSGIISLRAPPALV